MPGVSRNIGLECSGGVMTLPEVEEMYNANPGDLGCLVCLDKPA